MSPTPVPGKGRQLLTTRIGGNPLQYSCLENSMDRGDQQATVHGVAKSQTRLSDFTCTFFHCCLSSCFLVICSLTQPSSMAEIRNARPQLFLPPDSWGTYVGAVVTKEISRGMIWKTVYSCSKGRGGQDTLCRKDQFPSISISFYYILKHPYYCRSHDHPEERQQFSFSLAMGVVMQLSSD